MNFIKNVLFQRPVSTVNFSDNPCFTCDDPCAQHEQLPEYLANKIENGDMINSFKPYKRHVLVKLGQGGQWAPSLDEVPNSFMEKVVQTLPSQKGNRTMMTAFHDVDDSQSAPETTTEAQCLIFPDGIEIPSLSKDQLSLLGEWIAKEGDLPVELNARPCEKQLHVFVCTHKKRDKRCGVSGPMLLKEFEKQLKELNLENKVGLYGVSHIGGHKFAGNVIIYHPSEENKLVADWYGRVKTCHVGHIIQETLLKGLVFKSLWRGRMDGGRSLPETTW
ncbi:Sucrase/ferredoxin-like-domain-containing protein [Gorgonomyces haynaldii]|nr:Sucrase/ferredoxin-like-domain-containing protein [Gorgonomyces haynaldii]